ncbi:TPA: hypothetical protein U5D94_003737 [Yersinia enterocolitica]|nr:hypothetical protein [Yersinia enterocolitica]
MNHVKISVNNKNEFVKYDSNNNFGVRISTHTLIPYDPISGQDIGFFERWNDGEIQLTTFRGYAPIVTECLLTKGYKNRITMIPLHSWENPHIN